MALRSRSSATSSWEARREAISGIHPSILAALRVRPDLDAIIYIPMPGFARSMNVAAATCAALYEHRRQHPRPASKNGGRAHGEGCTKETSRLNVSYEPVGGFQG
jgi:hypothetical protein